MAILQLIDTFDLAVAMMLLVIGLCLIGFGLRPLAYDRAIARLDEWRRQRRARIRGEQTEPAEAHDILPPATRARAPELLWAGATVLVIDTIASGLIVS